MSTPENIRRIAEEVSPQAASLLMLLDKIEESLGIDKPKFPTVKEQQKYWQEKDDNLDKTESCSQWFDEQERDDLRDDGRSGGQGESYSERNT